MRFRSVKFKLVTFLVLGIEELQYSSVTGRESQTKGLHQSRSSLFRNAGLQKRPFGFLRRLQN